VENLENISLPSPAALGADPSVSQPNSASPSSIPSGQPTEASQGIAHPTSSASNKEPTHSGPQEMTEKTENPQNSDENAQDFDIN
jgi:hypothetical protein